MRTPFKFSIRVLLIVTGLVTLPSLPGCKTKAELRREQEFERLKEDIKEVKGDKADIEVTNEELRADLARLTSVIDEQTQWTHRQIDEVRKDVVAISGRVSTLEQKMGALEQKTVADEVASRQMVEQRAKPTLENGKKLFDEGKFEEATEVLRNFIKAHPRTDEAKKAQFLMADAYFANKDFASAALEYSEYKKAYAKDPLIPSAIYKQAQSFRSMGKIKEARLFYQELIERFPKHPLAAKAKQESRKLK